jgi:hypothetical protein
MNRLPLSSAILFLFAASCLMPREVMAGGTNTNSIAATNLVTPSVSAPSTNSATTQLATNPPASNGLSTNPSTSNPPTLTRHELPEIHGSISLPSDWTLLPGKLLEGDVLIATKEKVSGENDPYTTGLSMTLDRNGARESGQKATEYAMSLAREAHDKAGEEASPLHESQEGTFHEIRFDFPVAGDQPLQITEVLRANEKTGTLAIILWQSPKEESASLRGLRDAILSGLSLDPEK